MQFLKELIKQKNVIWQLAKNDCRARFASSGLGVVWAFLQPLLNIIVIWVVFQVGFKSMPVENVPFIVWYIPAFLSWNFFSEAVSQATNSLMEYSYLLKKVNFQATVIPLIKVVSSAIIHMGFIIFIVIINLIYGRVPTIYYLQMIYYFFCAFCLCASIGWLLSSIAAFIKDTANLIAVVLQIGFWASPLMWDPSQMSPIIRTILKINPMFYVCMGYRESVVNGIPFWHHPLETLYFWAIVVIAYVCGSKLFTKLRPHFDDVL